MHSYVLVKREARQSVEKCKRDVQINRESHGKTEVKSGDDDGNQPRTVRATRIWRSQEQVFL